MMIKITATVTALLLTSLLFAQQDSLKGRPYNRWSVELNAGQNKAIKPFTTGYYSANPDKYFNFTGVNHFDVGVRYMLSETFGFKLDGAYDLIKNQKGSGSLPFRTESYRLGLQAVTNLGHIMNFNSFTKRFGLLAHAGVQVSRFTVATYPDEDNGGVILGLTPQFKLTRWCALTGDFTYVGNLRQHYTWDGQLSSAENNLSGSMVHTSLGLTFYLGKKENHADWYIAKVEASKIEHENSKRIAELETLMNDTDRDGVLDYLDQENNTPGGVAVDTKGRFIDLNKNGVPDELEKKDSGFNQTNNQYNANNNGVSHVGGDINVLKALVENGSVNVFYDINEDFPNVGSTNSVYQILQYLKNFQDAKIQLTGYADIRGKEKINKDLSQRRAVNLKKVLVASGINSERISIAGQGVDKEYKATKTGLDLARRVSVSIKK